MKKEYTKFKVGFLFAWYDVWVGFFWDSGKRWLYILPIPCCGIILKLPKEITKYCNSCHKHMGKLDHCNYERCQHHKWDLTK